jgi:hypothetical protein
VLPQLVFRPIEGASVVRDTDQTVGEKVKKSLRALEEISGLETCLVAGKGDAFRARNGGSYANFGRRRVPKCNTGRGLQALF